MSGMSYLYTDMYNAHLVPRIHWIRADGTSVSQAELLFDSEKVTYSFFVQKRPHHPPDLAPGTHRCVCHRVKCHDDREYEWLRAFLKVVTWIEEHTTLSKNQ